jgi:hypothetical protein
MSKELNPMRDITLITDSGARIPVFISEEDFDDLQDVLVAQCEQFNIASSSLVRVEVGKEVEEVQ